jgi:hypothetical protein
MGLLDDAIREHLDLKRRRGADPAEVERAESEALGPARRDPFENVDVEPGTAVADEPPYDEALEQEHVVEPAADDWGDAFDDAPLPAETPPPPAETASQPAPHPADEPPGEETVEYDVEDALDAERPDVEHQEPAPAPPEPAPASPEPVHPEPGQPEPGQPEPGQPEPSSAEADVLEETPEFLQDTPDHDRLWFEQRPPRDFDFDG